MLNDGVILLPDYARPYDYRLSQDRIESSSCRYLLKSYVRFTRKSVSPYNSFVTKHPSIIYKMISHRQFSGICRLRKHLHFGTNYLNSPDIEEAMSNFLRINQFVHICIRGIIQDNPSMQNISPILVHLQWKSWKNCKATWNRKRWHRSCQLSSW